VIDAMVGLVTFTELERYYRVNRPDFVFFVAAMAGILVFGIIAGIVIGVVLSLLLLIARSSQTSVRRLGRDPDSGVYHAALDERALETTPGVLVVRIDGPLFFADADRFRARVKQLVGEEGMVSGVVVDAESVFLTDTDGADILSQVARELRAQGTEMALACVHPGTLDLWRRAGAIEATGDRTFETVSGAVASLAGASVGSPVADDAAVVGRS
jgi:SulP family sulfate permease